MKLALVLVFVLLCSGREPEDKVEHLGVLSRHTVIPLERNSDRSDFSHFEVEARTLVPGLTNPPVKFSTTNEFLSVTNFPALPSGKALLSVKVVTGGTGPSSLPSLYTFELWRTRPPKPTAGRVTHVLGKRDDEGMEQALARRRERRKAEAALPPMPQIKGRTNQVAGPLPLPGGNSEEYSEHLDSEARKAMREYFLRSRRN